MQMSREFIRLGNENPLRKESLQVNLSSFYWNLPRPLGEEVLLKRVRTLDDLRVG